MQTNDILNTIKRFDAYPKTLEDFRVKTLGGGAGIKCSFCFIGLLKQAVFVGLYRRENFTVCDIF